MNRKSSELSLQLFYIDNQILVVCTGSSGEAYSFINESDVEVLIKRSMLIHQHIDKFFSNESESYDSDQSLFDGGEAAKDVDSQNLSPKKKLVKSLDLQKERVRLSENLRKFGEFLFKSVFKNQILDLLNIAIGQAIRLKNDVLIRLMIASEFLNLVPWELLHDGERYLCHVYDIVRHPFSLQAVRKPIAINESIRLLFIGANPPPGDIYVQGQIEAAQAALDSTNIQFEKLLDTTYKNIANGIYDGVTILHFLAHGECEYDGKNLKYYFRIDSEDENKQYDKLPIEMLESFCRANPMRIAVLNACRSDQAFIYSKSKSVKKLVEKLSKSDYYSMAHALIKTGVPCVMGMSHPISKIGAEILTRRLYRTLNSKGGSVYKAVRQIRLELFAHTDFLPPSDWLTPVLYLRGTDEDGLIQTE